MKKGKIKYYVAGFIPCSHSYELPETFSELNSIQLETWAELVWDKQLDWFDTDEDGNPVIDDVQSYVAYHIEFARILMMAPPYVWDQLGYDEIRNLLFHWKITKPFFNDKPKLKVNPVPGFKGLIGPISPNYLSAWEFTYVDSSYMKVKKTREHDDLDRFVSFMYREMRPDFDESDPEENPDPREKFAEHTEPLRRHVITEMPRRKKLIILFWYEEWRMMLFKFFPHVFNGKNQEKAKKSQTGWLQVLLNASDGAKHFEAIKATNINVLLADINRVIENNKELTEGIKK